nr:RNA-directed DNA polymerase, eukaryota [Tanacetum cinerariifolium]
MWVLFEFDSIASKEKFLNHSGISSWFTDLIQATSSFENDERIAWISIEGLLIKAWTPNIFVRLHLYGVNDQYDLSSDGESQEGDVTNKADNNESDVDRVSELSFMHENDTAHKDVNSYKKESDEPKFPPGFTPGNNDQEKNIEENIKDTTERVQSLSNKLNDRCSNRGFSSQRSLGNKAKRRWIKELCQKHRINFASIQETKAGSISLHTIKDLWGNQMFDHVVGSSVELNGMRDLWDYLRTLIDRWEGDTVIMGDFNEVRSKHERFGSTFNRQGAIAFNNFISSTCLIDLPLEGYAFTWAHKSASKMSKFDRYLISEGVLDLFPHLSALCLDRHLSDHRPILLRETNYDYGPSPFRFFHSWPFILNELLSWYKFKKLNGMIFTVDFEKAFDSVKCDYLDETLKAFGFGSKWRNWISSCLINAMRSVLVKGSPTLEFQFHKGLKQAADSLIDYSILTALFNYLGVKFGSNMSRITSWDDVISKVSSRLSKWKLKLLSIGGCLSLLKLVLTSILLYHMSIFKVPIGVLNHLESIRRNFFYGVDGALDTHKLIPRRSPWQDVILAIHSLQSKGEVALKVLYKRLYALEMRKSISVAEKIGHPSLSRAFRMTPRGSQEFSVKSSRILIDNTILQKVEVPTRWLRVVLIKVNVHAWRVCLDKLPTRANLSLRGMDIPSIACVLCNSAVESSSHIFFACLLARQVWRKF